MQRRRMTWRGGLAGALLAGLLTGTALAAGPFAEPEASVLHSFDGEQAGDGFGWEAENIGDITGDGVHEFITSAPFSGPAAGKIYIFAGSGGPALSSFTGDPFDQLGYSVSRAGDVNADGTPDYIAGGPGLPGGPIPFKGRAVVFSGRDHSVIHELAAPQGIRLGAAVAGAGDVNGDGHADLIVGAPRAGAGGSRVGRVYLFSGNDGSVLWSRDGQWPGGTLGLAVGLVGDVNGDGVPDQAAGAPGAGKQGKGEVYVLSGADGRVLHTLRPVGEPGQGTKSFGFFFASGPGDMDGDGVPDVFVGDWNATRDGVSGTGRAYLFSGRTGNRITVFNAEELGDGFGVGRGVGDVDGDGRPDLIIAGYTSSAGAAFGGKAYLYSGRTHHVLRTITGAVAGDLLGVDALGIGDVNGDGLTDFILTTGNGALEHVYIVAGTSL